MSISNEYSDSDLHEAPAEYLPGDISKKFDLEDEDWGKFGEPHSTDVEGIYFTEEDIQFSKDLEHTLEVLKYFDIAVPTSVYSLVARNLPSKFNPDESLETEFQAPKEGYTGQYHRISI